MTAPNLRDEVRIAMGLRELAEYVPVDTRRVCETCGRRDSVLWAMSLTLCKITKHWEECGRCLKNRRAA